VLIGGVGVYAAKRMYFDPAADYRKTIAKIEEDNQTLQDQLDQFERERGKLVLARLKSLPNVAKPASDYLNAYLKPLLRECGLTEIVDTHTDPIDVKMVTPIPTVKKVGHKVFTCTIRCKGELPQLVKAMERMRQTPYEHRIKTLTVERQSTSTSKSASSALAINMVVEALVVADTKVKPGLPPGIDPRVLLYDQVLIRNGFAPAGWGLLAATVMNQQLMPVPAYRDYEKIGDKNIFVGAIPVATYIPSVTKDKGPLPPPPEPSVNVPKYIYLIHTEPNKEEAYLHNRVYKKPFDTKVSAKASSGYDTFRIIDDDTGHVFFKAKVLRVESREVWIQIVNHVYKLHVGQSLADAIEFNEVREFRADLIDLGLYDEAWAAKELESEKKDNKGKTSKKTKGGR
jgi:hypothetical protein